MKYELAKQLKEAGFPQRGRTLRYAFRDKETVDCYRPAINEDEVIKIPTLEELIDACGDKFYGVVQPQTYTENCEWRAEDKTGKIFGFGKTSLEAVAKLWLKLNK